MVLVNDVEFWNSSINRIGLMSVGVKNVLDFKFVAAKSLKFIYIVCSV